jgi:hypothetical protein
MPLMHCPHCGAENFTMEGWEDLDHCSSCGRPLDGPVRDPRDYLDDATRAVAGHSGRRGGDDQRTKKPRRA